jgi:hypothetical protein
MINYKLSLGTLILTLLSALTLDYYSVTLSSQNNILDNSQKSVKVIRRLLTLIWIIVTVTYIVNDYKTKTKQNNFSIWDKIKKGISRTQSSKSHARQILDFIIKNKENVDYLLIGISSLNWILAIIISIINVLNNRSLNSNDGNSSLNSNDGNRGTKNREDELKFTFLKKFEEKKKDDRVILETNVVHLFEELKGPLDKASKYKREKEHFENIPHYKHIDPHAKDSQHINMDQNATGMHIYMDETNLLISNRIMREEEKLLDYVLSNLLQKKLEKLEKKCAFKVEENDDLDKYYSDLFRVQRNLAENIQACSRVVFDKRAGIISFDDRVGIEPLMLKAIYDANHLNVNKVFEKIFSISKTPIKFIKREKIIELGDFIRNKYIMRTYQLRNIFYKMQQMKNLRLHEINIINRFIDNRQKGIKEFYNFHDEMGHPRTFKMHQLDLMKRFQKNRQEAIIEFDESYKRYESERRELENLVLKCFNKIYNELNVRPVLLYEDVTPFLIPIE